MMRCAPAPRALIGLLAALTLATARPAAAQQVTTDASFVVRLSVATLAAIALDGRTGGGRYDVTGELSTRGIVSALSDVHYLGKARGSQAGNRFRPARYDETVTEGGDSKIGALAYSGGVPRPEGFKAEERGDDALAVEGQADTVDPLTAIFMVLRDQPPEEVCPPLRQFVFDGERRTVVELTRVTETADQIVCGGQFRRIAGYPSDARKGQRQVLALEVTYARAGAVMQAQQVRLMTDYGPATLTRQ